MSMDDDVTRLPEGQGQPPNELQLAEGEDFGPYRILRLLGRGGMGEVYEAEHRDLRTRHALKLISPEIVDRPDAKERFKREARVMARLRHPNIVHVDDFGELDGRIWLRMDLIEKADMGGRGLAGAGLDGVQAVSLADLSRGKPLPSGFTREIIAQVLKGLSYAHKEGVVHRDLKPSNILLQANDSESNCLIPKITDFGLVSLVGADWFQSQVQLTVAQSAVGSTGSPQVDPDATWLDSGSGASSAGSSTEAMLGTVAYMSPEQKKGGAVDARSDLYAVGKIVFQMLTGQDNVGFEMPSDLVPGLDPAWDDWVKRAVASRPERRWDTAEAMRDTMPGANDPPPTADSNDEMTAPDSVAVAKARSGEAQAGAGRKPSRRPAGRRSGLLLAGLGIVLVSTLLFVYSKRGTTEPDSGFAAGATAAEPSEAARAQAVEVEVAAPTKGGLSVNVEPEDANVTVEGLIEGHRGDLHLEAVEAGSYGLRVDRAGFKGFSEEIVIVAGEMKQLPPVRLEKEPAVIEVKTDPAGAAVFRDGEAIGKTPLRLDALEDGESVRLRLAKDGYADGTLSAVAEAGRTIPLYAAMREYHGPAFGRDWQFQLTRNVSLSMKWIPEGEFLMGSPPTEQGRMVDERQHKVRLTDGFWMGQFEVTQAEWVAVMQTNPSQGKFSTFSDPMRQPVERVTWNEAMEFCRRLNQAARTAKKLPPGYIYSLPTEAQWEYACRAGTTTRFYGGDSLSDLNRIAWTHANKNNIFKLTREVGQKTPNDFGLYDITGNVWEWCLTDLTDGYPTEPQVNPRGLRGGPIRTIRGGSWADYPEKCRTAFRGGVQPNTRKAFIGFRVALIPDKYQ